MSEYSRREILIRKIDRRNPFKIVHSPLLAHLYRYPIEKWGSERKKLIIFGAPSLLLFSFLQRFSPFKHTGTFALQINNETQNNISFDARNTQFSALYMADFATGYEPEIMAFLDIIMPQSGVFYDIGSNWGFFSLFVASKPGFKGKVIAFEPFPPSYNDLKKVIAQSTLYNHIKCYPLALSDQNGKTSMYIPGLIHNSGLATMLPNSSGSIKMAKLDSLNLDPPSVIKIDTEGTEYSVLVGAKRLLSRYKPIIVFENWRNLADVNHTLKPIIFLYKLGYLFFHPCWLKKEKNLSYFMPSETKTHLSSVETLALIPLSLEDRFLRHDQINIISCHRDNLDTMYKLFEIYKNA